MTGVATDVRFAVGELAVDLLDHREHHTGHELRRFFIARALLRVAVVAHYAQAGGGDRIVGMSWASSGSTFRFV